MTIRPVDANDVDEIYRLHREAFDDEEAELVAHLAIALLRDETAEPRSAFVAVDEGRIVGCVIFSSVQMDGDVPVNAAILAPLAVAKEHQRVGIGSALVRHGLAALTGQGIEMVFVYGDPSYYSRFGFAPGHRVAAPFPLSYPDAWMACELVEGRFREAAGTAQCAVVLSQKEYW